MKKLLPILAFLTLLVVPWQAQCQMELTVADDIATNQNVPVYGTWADQAQHNQMIYPAEMLTEISGATLMGLTFYQQNTSSWSSDQVTISLAEVDVDTFTSATHLEATLTQVWSGAVGGSNTEWVIDFEEFYTYNGGNLLIDIQTTAGTWNNCNYYGISRSNAALRSYGGSNLALQSFLPKATFSYAPAGMAACYKPTNLSISDISITEATLHWSTGGSETAWQVFNGDVLVATVTDTLYTFTNLDAATKYIVGVKAVCGSENFSLLTATTFRTAYEGDYVTIADSTATDNYIPIYGYFIDQAQHNQLLYPASMLTELVGDSLTGFIFYMNQLSTADWGTTVTVSLAEVYNESVPSLIDANLIQVWQGEFSGMESEWYLHFDNSYRYTGGNLLVDITTTAGTFKSSSFYGIATSDNSSICTHGNSFHNQTFLPKVAIFYAESDAPVCYMPFNLQVGEINDNGFTLSWEPRGEEEAWQITLTDATGSTIYNVTEASYTFNQLNPATEYTVEVRADCGNDGLSGAASTTVTTLMAGFEMATVPYSTGFGEDDDPFWEFVNDTTNAWYMGYAVDSNNRTLYISQDGGASNTYQHTSGSHVSYAYRLMEIEETGLYYFQFDYKGKGESNYDYLRAWVAPASVELTANKLPNGTTGFSNYTTATPTGWYDLGGQMNLKDSWTHVAQGVELMAGNYRLVLMWCNDSYGSDPAIAVDNIDITQLTEVTINARSVDETMGTVEGADSYAYGAEVTLTAVPVSNNYYFTHWSTGDTNATITLTANLEAMTTEYIAYFEANVVTVTVDVNYEEGGTVEGAGEYPNGDSAVLTAIPNDGWVFTQWSDGNTDNPRIIENLAANVHLTAQFVHLYGVVEDMAIDFEENGDEYFFFANGTGVNQWVIGNTNADNHALFISNDGGQSNNYTNTQNTSVFAYMTVTLDAGFYDYSFDNRVNGEAIYDFMRVALVPANVELIASNNILPSDWSNNTLPEGAIALDRGGHMARLPEVGTMSDLIGVDEAGDYNLVFYWRNNYTGGDNPAAMVDNIFMARNNNPISIIAHGAQERGEVSLDMEEYFYGDSAFLTAEPYDNYIFDHWRIYDGYNRISITYSPDEMPQTMGIRVDAVTPKAEYFAYFLPEYPTLTVEYNSDFGMVIGIENGQVSVANGDSVIIEAVPYDGYFFGGWSDGSRENPRTIVLTDDRVLGCVFGEPNDSTIIDFENGETSNWTLANGTYTNAWTFGTVPYDTATTTALMISNDGGVSNAYTYTSSAGVFAYYPISLKAGIYQSSFEWKANGENNFDFLRAALVPSNIALQPTTSNASGWSQNTLPTGAIALDGGTKRNLTTEWQTETYNVEVPENGMYNLVFYWRNDYSEGNQTPAAVDNISLVNTHARYMVNTYPQDGDYGYVDGGGQYDYGEQVTLIAHPYVGYMVAFWTHNNDTLYGESITVKVTSDETPYVAWLTPPSVTIHTDYIHDLISVYDQDNNFIESYSEYTYEGGRNLTFTAVIAEGYQVDILLNGIHGNYLRESGYNTTSTLNLFAGDNYNLEFYWRGIPVQVTVNATNGTDNTFGTIATYYGNDISIVAAPAPGYQFLGWEDDPSASSIRSFTVDFTHDTTFTAIIEPIVCLPDTEYVHDTTVITDTAYVEVEIHDTTYVDVHDTTYVDVHDTTYVEVPVHDTTYVDVHDTTYVDVHDTTYVDVHDTTYVEVPVHDTTFVDVHDTTYVEVPVHDTTFVDVHDTTYVDVHDTTYVEVPIHDTTIVTEVDTLTLVQFDTVYLQVAVHDTTTMLVHDTMYVNRYIYDSLYFYDTTYVHDTTYITNWKHDTTYVTVNDSIIQTLVDTMYIYVNDTTQIYNIVHDTTYINIHDTTVIINYDTLTVTNTVYSIDTVILNNYIHDTTVVDHFVHDTTYIPVHDTMYVYRYTHDSLYFYDTTYVHDTSYVYQWRYDTTYVTINDSIIQTLVDTMYIYVNDTTQIYNFVHDTTLVFIHDTTIVTLYDTLTVTNTIVDSVILNNYIHDTAIVTLYDTITLTQTDTVTNTEYVFDTVTNTVYDTVTNTVYDTVTNTEYVYDTVTNTVYDTVTNTEYVFDTTLVTDTLWLTDTVYITLTDTVYIHDTVYVGIDDDATMANVKLYQRDGQIIVEGAEGARVMLFDAVGRQLATKTDEYDVLRFDVPSTGAYLIKVGNAPARRIVVVR